MGAKVANSDGEDGNNVVADSADGAGDAGVVVGAVFADDAGFGVDAHGDEGEG